MGHECGRFNPPPAFVKVDFLALMLWPVDDPDVVPVPITGADCTIGKYHYSTNLMGDVWAGEWHNVYGDGDWHFAQQTVDDRSTQTCFSLYFTEPALGKFIAEWSATNYNSGLWNDAFVDRHGATEWVMPSYPFVFLDFASVQAVNYSATKATGYDPRNTRPRSFFYDL